MTIVRRMGTISSSTSMGTTLLAPSAPLIELLHPRNPKATFEPCPIHFYTYSSGGLLFKLSTPLMICSDVINDVLANSVKLGSLLS